MMNKVLMKFIFAIVAIVFFCSCAHYKDVAYFQNSEEFDGSKGARLYDLKIKPKDRLSIFVTSTNPEACEQFRLIIPPSAEDAKDEKGHIRVNTNQYGRSYYQVDNEGMINFPVIGKVSVEGKTIQQINQTIEECIAPYFQKDADYQVNTYIQNFQISVLGEVKNPNTFTITKNECNVLEALAMAGDMTIYGKRDNVKILRELADGTYEVHELDMRDANILNSPYYYLEQRDIVYVEPNEAMAQNSKIGQTTQLWVRGASITISLGSLLYMVLK